jgi:hypothetical protein
MTMPARLGAVLCVALCCIATASCTTHESVGGITEKQAAEIGMKACHSVPPQPGANWHWQARHRPWRNDIWQVWIAGDDNRWNSGRPHVEVFSDGTAGDCVEPILSDLPE